MQSSNLEGKAHKVVSIALWRGRKKIKEKARKEMSSALLEWEKRKRRCLGGLPLRSGNLETACKDVMSSLDNFESLRGAKNGVAKLSDQHDIRVDTSLLSITQIDS